MERESAPGASLERAVTGRGGNLSGQGPFIQVTLYHGGDVVLRATYETYQCPGCQACGKAICEMVAGMPLKLARAIRHEHLVERVGPLPSYRRHCYGLALLALAHALEKLQAERTLED